MDQRHMRQQHRHQRRHTPVLRWEYRWRRLGQWRHQYEQPLRGRRRSGDGGPRRTDSSGNFSFGGSLLVSGGTLVLSGDNTYAGGTSIDGGTLSFAAGALPIGSPNIVIDGGTLQWASGNTEDVSAGLARSPRADGHFRHQRQRRDFRQPHRRQRHAGESGAGTLTLTAPGTLPSGLTINDPGNLIVPGGVTMTATTGIVGMDVTLVAAVADPFGDCTGVTLTLRTPTASRVHHDGQWPASRRPLFGHRGHKRLGSGCVHNHGHAHIHVEHTSYPRVHAGDGRRKSDGRHGDCWPHHGRLSGIGASGAFKTVVDSAAYGGQYREMTGTDNTAYATYTFSGLSPGTYELWANYSAGSQHPNNAALSVYDGLAAAGHLQATFTINQQAALSTSNWGVRSLDGSNWGWLYNGMGTTTVGTVYINNSDGILTAVLPYSGMGTAAPTLLLIADPQPEGPYDAGTLGGRRSHRTRLPSPTVRL